MLVLILRTVGSGGFPSSSHVFMPRIPARNKHCIIDCPVYACAWAWRVKVPSVFLSARALRRRRAQPYEKPITIPGVPVA